MKPQNTKHPNQTTNRLFLLVFALGTLMLSGCSSTPPPPDWKMNAVSLLEHAQQRWLEGDSKAAELALHRMRQEIAQSGRIDMLARAELAACATRIASLDFSPCVGFDTHAADAAASDQAYARFLAADWAGLEIKALPAHYAKLLAAKDDLNANLAAREIKDPLPRLIAAALLFRNGRAEPSTMSVAIETASERGWRRPLLTWLEVQLKRAQSEGDQDAMAALQRRIDLILGQAKSP
jgi:outer membrane murein-binding lipoprotein Lpp